MEVRKGSLTVHCDTPSPGSGQGVTPRDTPQKAQSSAVFRLGRDMRGKAKCHAIWSAMSRISICNTLIFIKFLQNHARNKPASPAADCLSPKGETCHARGRAPRVTSFGTMNPWPLDALHIVEEVGRHFAVVILDRLNHAHRFQLVSVALARLTLGRAIL